MKSRPSDRACEKALNALTREASDLALPDIDWERIEARVLDAAARPPVSLMAVHRPVSPVRWVPRAPTWASTPWPIAVAAAAAAALIYGSAPGALDRSTRAEEARMTARDPHLEPANLSSLEVGEVAETGVRTAVYDKPGVVSFALAPNTRIEVVANDVEKDHIGGGITVALSRGSIHADVQPRAVGEVFAIEVERTRIAVHGTSFTVSREGERVIVDVAHGSVAVGPVGHRGATHGWLVVGPDRAAFSLDGAREATWGLAAAAVASAVVEPVVETPAAAVANAPASRTKRPPLITASAREANVTRGDANAAATAAPIVAAWGEGATVDGRDPSEQETAAASAIVRHLVACYEKQSSAFGVRFTVESSLELTLLPSGAIREGVFTPPLSPTLMSCADKAIGAAHFPKGEASRRIRIPVQLSRAPR